MHAYVRRCPFFRAPGIVFFLAQKLVVRLESTVSSPEFLDGDDVNLWTLYDTIVQPLYYHRRLVGQPLHTHEVTIG
jgi:hypothetical protein